MTFGLPLYTACDVALPSQLCEVLTADKSLYFAIGTLGLLPLAFLLERRFPARPRQVLLSVGFAHDAIWWALYPLLKMSLYAGFLVVLAGLFDHHLGFLKIHAVQRLPVALQIALVVAASDFLAWLHHYVRHKVPLFWHFHAIHHSQTELNVLSDLRVHPVDFLVARLIMWLPFCSLSLDMAVPTIAAWEIFKNGFTRFCHANIRTDLGPLRYILVTPQSHRIHHSREERHADRNFGVIFSVWDRLLGTAHVPRQEYPQTGIADPDFPLEREITARSLVSTPLRQLAYPFVCLFGGVDRAPDSS